MEIHKSKRAKGNFHHKTPSGTNAKSAKSYACKEISEYIQKNKDFGEINYLAIERIVLISTSQNKPFTYFI